MKAIFSIILLLGFVSTYAQDPNYPPAPPALVNIVAAEYWIDTDPGIGNATAISVTAATDITNTLATLNTTGLSNGIHRYGLRTKGIDGKWSLTNINEFLVDHNPGYATPPSAITNIVAAEYFIDTDPGMGNGTSIAITPGQNIPNIYFPANTTGLSNSTHFLVIRSKNSNGVWSLSNVVPFLVSADFSYPDAPAAPGNITYAEYFFDTDPGFGNGTIIPITPGVDLANVSFAANTSALSDGVHTLFIRSLDDWSLTNFVSFTKGSVTAIRLLNFNAVANGNKVFLNWQTGTEEITDKMVLQRSKDGIHFSDIASIPTKGLPSAYTYSDENPFDGRNYYRLKMLDINNETTYSIIASVNISGKDELAVQAYPNPVTNKLNLTFHGDIQPSAQIVLSNMEGKEILRIRITNATQEINMANMSKGVYLLRYTNGNKQQAMKIVKQ